jgi:hypothetical protein
MAAGGAFKKAKKGAELSNLGQCRYFAYINGYLGLFWGQNSRFDPFCASRRPSVNQAW